jgi:hypothetical protein
MLTVDAAFDRLGSALRQRGYTFAQDERPEASPGDRVSLFTSPSTSVRITWFERARLLTIQVKVAGEWVEFARRGFGPNGLEDGSVEALVRAVFNEVAETSTDAD